MSIVSVSLLALPLHSGQVVSKNAGSKGRGDPVIAMVLGDFWTGAMDNNKDKQEVKLLFYNMRDGRSIWSLQRKLTYFKIKKKRPW